MTKSVWRLVMAAAAAAALVSACGGTKMDVSRTALELPDQALYEHGMKLQQQKKYINSRSVFRQLELRNPTGDLGALVKIALADSYWFEGSKESRVEAVAMFKSFLSFYPKHPRACYSQFMVGEYHFENLEKPDRDQTETWKAIEELQKLVVSYPECEYADQARSKLTEGFNRLAESEMKVGDFYYKLGRIDAALGRYLAVRDNYVKYPGRDKAIYRLCRIYKKIGDEAAAEDMRTRLATEFPESSYNRQLEKAR